MYGDDGRSAYNSVNFITCHDGFTLNDLVSYNQKHNEANQENNNDGTNDNNSWNCGVEGPTADPGVLALLAWSSRGATSRSPRVIAAGVLALLALAMMAWVGADRALERFSAMK